MSELIESVELLESVKAEDMSYGLEYLENKLRTSRPGSSAQLRTLKSLIAFRCLYVLKKHCS